MLEGFISCGETTQFLPWLNRLAVSFTLFIQSCTYRDMIKNLLVDYSVFSPRLHSVTFL